MISSFYPGNSEKNFVLNVTEMKFWQLFYCYYCVSVHYKAWQTKTYTLFQNYPLKRWKINKHTRKGQLLSLPIKSESEHDSTLSAFVNHRHGNILHFRLAPFQIKRLKLCWPLQLFEDSVQLLIKVWSQQKTLLFSVNNHVPPTAFITKSSGWCFIAPLMITNYSKHMSFGLQVLALLWSHYYVDHTRVPVCHLTHYLI